MEKKYQCRQCKNMLSEGMYYRDNRTANGMKGICKACLRDNYNANRKARIEYQLQWNYEHYDKVLEYIARYNDRKYNHRRFNSITV